MSQFPTWGTTTAGMIYNTTYEKGNAQERFVWTSDGKQAAFIQYQVIPGWADPATIKSLSSQ